MKPCLSLLWLLLLFVPRAGIPCSTFLLQSQTDRFLGKSYDWNHSNGYVLVNKRNMAKTALAPDPSTTNLASWISKYGSVTFNQHGREFPLGGYNEAGLAVEVMWLDEAQWPAPDSRPVINELQWIQYQLDNYSSVAEMVANVNKVRIQGVYAQVHYLACDKGGSCATFEALNGQMVVHTRDGLPVPALTNDTYDNSISYLKNFVGFGGSDPIPSGRQSLDRFVRAASLIQNPKAVSQSAAFDILTSIRQGRYTKFNIVYNLLDGEVAFRTTALPTIRWFESANFNYSCKTQVLMFSMTTPASGDITDQFIPYTAQANLSNVHAGFAHLPISKQVQQAIAAYPDSTKCEE